MGPQAVTSITMDSTVVLFLKKLGLTQGVRAPSRPPCLGTPQHSCLLRDLCQGRSHLLSGTQQALNMYFLAIGIQSSEKWTVWLPRS